MDVKITSLDHAPPRTQRPSRTLRREAFAPYLFILPFGVLFLLFFIVPIIYAIYQSLFRSERNGLGLGAATVSYAASASFLGIPDEDSASLVQLLVTSMQQLNTLNQQLGTIRQTYSETKKLAGFAEDAVNAFQGLARAEPCSR